MKKKTVSVRRITPGDSNCKNTPAFEMRVNFESYKERKKKEARLNGPCIRCNGCGASSRETEICMSVYHSGRYCDGCLMDGMCDTDPNYDSKWEAWDPYYDGRWMSGRW